MVTSRAGNKLLLVGRTTVINSRHGDALKVRGIFFSHALELLLALMAEQPAQRLERRGHGADDLIALFLIGSGAGGRSGIFNDVSVRVAIALDSRSAPHCGGGPCQY